MSAVARVKVVLHAKHVQCLLCACCVLFTLIKSSACFHKLLQVTQNQMLQLTRGIAHNAA